MAELWPRASNRASKKRTTTIGCRIQRLLLRRKAKNSLATALRLATVEGRLINDTDGLGRRRPGENVTSPLGSGQSRLSHPHRDSRIPLSAQSLARHPSCRLTLRQTCLTMRTASYDGLYASRLVVAN